MINQTNTHEQESIKGSVERVTFHSSESGFCVLRVNVKGQRDLVTVVGNAAAISAGEFIETQGFWVHDKTHGLQFNATQLTTVSPNTLEGMQKYLGSGMIKGIGPHFAKKLIHAFKEQVFDVIEREPARLNDVPGIGKKRQQTIIKAWAEQKYVREIMVFLQSHGVGTARAVRIFKKYGDNAIEIVKQNPYRLAVDIRGIGFKTADTIALNIGITRDSLVRAQAGVCHVVQSLCDHGDCAVVQAELVKAATALLEIPASIIETALENELHEERLIREMIDDKACIYPLSLYNAEVKTARYLQRINEGLPPWGFIDVEKALPWVTEQTGLTLSDSQQQAVKTVLESKLSIITGGPGVGKTTIVNSILKIINTKQLTVGLAAPTGRAAKRLTETTGITAKTLHRLLEYDPQTHGFKHHQDNPLLVDFLIVDEASMLDIMLMYRLLQALPKHAALLLVGDVDQLPSVGSGAVLSDLIASTVLTVVTLTEIFRQAATSHIITNAHNINQGKLPSSVPNQNGDFFIIEEEDVERLHDKLIHVVAKRIPDRFKVNPIQDIQVLTPMNRGGLGVQTLNATLQKTLNPNAKHQVTRYGTTFCPGDKVIQTVNNYDKEVFNGDIGVIDIIDSEENQVVVQFDQRLVDYDYSELDELSLAYAISIHKSQGSEYPVVVIPLAMQHYTLLARNLLYTAVTRGKQLVVLLVQRKALQMAVKNNQQAKRVTNLAYRLQH